MKTLFISGIDTNSGKTIATGLLARYLQNKSKTVITQKLVQTGCTTSIAEDILQHRKMMGIPLTQFDKDHITCSYVFKFPASPHLAAQLEDETVDTKKITQATQTLVQHYDYTLVEGAGGLYVPLNYKETILSYIQQQNYPLILVTSAKLGSINHTLMSIEIAYHHNINLRGIIYNYYPKQNKTILNDSKKIFKQYLSRYYPNAVVVGIPIINIEELPQINFEKLIP